MADDARIHLDPSAFALGEVLIAQVASEEAELYPELVTAYKTSNGRRSPDPDDSLAFGLEDLVIALSPLVYDVAKVTLSFLVTEATKMLQSVAQYELKEAEAAIEKRISEWIHRRIAPPPAVALNEVQSNRLIEQIKSYLATTKVDQAHADRIVNSIRNAVAGH